jgi:hypothetical protein
MKQFFRALVLSTTSLLVLLLPNSVWAAQTESPQAGKPESAPQLPTDLSWAGQKEHKKWAKQEQDIRSTKIEAEQVIKELQTDLIEKRSTADTRQTELENLKKRILDAKKIIPQDPWRNIYSEKKYVNSANSGFVRFSGQVQETNSAGIRIWGQMEKATDIEFFLINFPLPLKVGEGIDGKKIFVGYQDGEFAFVTEDGFAKKIQKLNYGKPCSPPENAKSVELEALQLTTQEKSQLAPIEDDAKLKNEFAITAKARLEEAIKRADLTQKSAWEDLQQDKFNAVKADEELAQVGSAEGLRRMGERYRDGDGVKQDLTKAADFFQRADNALQESAEQQRERERQREQEALKQRFARNLVLADTRKNVYSMLYISNCYSNGIGTDKDLVKAVAYFQKALGEGLPKLPNRF